ncbi:MAG: saccharopine dehydrogenase NADP-binding domain-containing protein [Desulfobacterales bacterium]|nr:MAG: saccharopine dehydrogenase NADP-binding domain-containing protein [Desulfobacterales bacterium]
MKKIIIIGVGAQGSTIARRMDEHPGVSEIICADYDIRAAEKLSKSLKKATAVKIDARVVNNLIKAAEGSDLMVNGLPLEFNLIIMEAALAVNASYVDMAGPMEDIGFVESYKLIFSEWHKNFKENELTALVGCGSSPGLANVIARESVDKLDTCDQIGIYIYEGVWARKFTPFWWSPEVAFGDMAYSTFRCENGNIVEDKPFSRPVMMKFIGIDQEIRMVDHEHDEPVTMGLLADKVLKGVKNVEFKYGGPHVELSESLYHLGLLSKEPVTVKGADIVPMDLVLKLCPPAPKFPDEIKAILDEGLVKDEGAFLVRVDGNKEGKPVRIDGYVNAPGLVEAFEKSGLSHEAYLTGQCASVFVKMMVDNAFTEKGVFVPEQLHADARHYCFQELAKLGITVNETVGKRIA